MKLSKLLKNRIVQNAGWIIGGRLANKLLSFLVGIITARYLGPDNYGLINYAAAFITFSASVQVASVPWKMPGLPPPLPPS